MRFKDRIDAGRRLAAALRRFQDKGAVVLGLPRGGAVVAAEVAYELNAPFGLVLVSKIGHPAYPEYAVGVMTEDGAVTYNPNELKILNPAWRKQAERKAYALLDYRRAAYFPDNYRQLALAHETVLLVDDGMATGLSMQAAVAFVRRSQPKRVIVAAPVASADSVRLLQAVADEVIVVDKPDHFLGAVGAHYRDFPPVDDEEVQSILEEMSHVIQR